jgi:glycosyltransferase involved in cell wall biosynthesis
VALSAKRPHKGLATLLDALARLPEPIRPVLVLPGFPTTYEMHLRRRVAELALAPDVRLPGWLSDADLDGLLVAASCVVLPSLSEGFGLPVLEAMARGVPVACSDRGALREIAGDAALLFDPTDPRQIADAIERLVTDRRVAERLVAAGRVRVGAFTWRRTAELTLESYARALATAPSA